MTSVSLRLKVWPFIVIDADPVFVQVLIEPLTCADPPLLPPPLPKNRLQPNCTQPSLPLTVVPVEQETKVKVPAVQSNSSVSPVVESCMLCVKFGRPMTDTV